MSESADRSAKFFRAKAEWARAAAASAKAFALAGTSEVVARESCWTPREDTNNSRTALRSEKRK